ncbi:MAG: hypothetical protein LBJ67_00655 [Planctomycetaceae bacterium]|jgi:hypothetical protein|nr:hypothetical protein [Planctomycetaceae bacterium]
MKRILFLAFGIFAVLLGMQLFCVQQVTLSPFVAEKMNMSPNLSVADYFPYGMICVGAVLCYYGYKTPK